jgi:putative flippase GtrA
MPVSSRTLMQIFLFGVTGVAGYVVDTSVLYAGLYLGLGLYLGRAISYLAAVTFTWVLNSRYTFRQRTTASRFTQWRRFAVSQLSGAVVNLGVYAALVRMSTFCADHPAVGVAAGSSMGMMVNFLAARRYVFNQ